MRHANHDSGIPDVHFGFGMGPSNDAMLQPVVQRFYAPAFFGTHGVPHVTECIHNTVEALSVVLAA